MRAFGHLWAAAAFALLAGAASAQAAELAPPGVQIKATELGPVFANAAGMTLYTRPLDDATLGKSQCFEDLNWTAVGGGSTWPVPYNDKRKSCAQKSPPFRPAANDKPVGKWSTITRTDGSLQWAYDNHPVYTSIRDQRPGDTNASIIVFYRQRPSALRPLYAPTGIPAGFEMKRTQDGLVLVTADKQVLYANEDAPKGKPCAQGCEEGWQPIIAPDGLTAQSGDWSIVPRPDHRRQWAFRGRPLYLPRPETSAQAGVAVKVASNGPPGVGPGKSPWRPVLYQKSAGDPPAVGVKLTLGGTIYTTAEGRTLYLYYCSDDSPDHTTCDQPGDAAAYRSSLCGSADECKRRWRPYLAGADARPVGMWSITDVADPPFLKATGRIGDGVPTVRGWAYAGRPVYTYFEDERPGDMLGDGIRGDYNSSGFFAALVPGEYEEIK